MGDSGQGHPVRRRTTAQVWLAALPCLLAALAVAVAVVVSWRTLPDPMAVRFGGDGVANRTASPWAILTFSQLSLLCAGAGAVRAAMVGTVSPRSVSVGSAAFGVFLGYLFTVLVLVNSGAGTAEAVRMPMWHLTVAAGLGTGVATVVWALSPRGARARSGGGRCPSGRARGPG